MKDQHQEPNLLRKRQFFFNQQIRKQHKSELINKRRSANLHKDSLITQNLNTTQVINISNFLALPDSQFQFDRINQYVTFLKSENIVEKHYGIISIRKLLISENPPYQQLIDMGLLFIIIQMAKQNHYIHLKYQALWCLNNFAASTQIHCQNIIDKGAIKIFHQNLSSQYAAISQLCIWAVGNIACDNYFHRDLFLKLGVKPLIQAMNKSKKQQMEVIKAWVLSNLCRGNPVPQFQSIKFLIPLVCQFIKKSADQLVLEYVLWALSYITQLKNRRLNLVIQTNVVPSLFRLLNHQSNIIIIPTIRTIGNILNSNSEITEEVLKNDISQFTKFLTHQKRKIRKEVCWLLSNITAGKTHQVDHVIKNQEMINELLQLIQKDVVQVKIQICYLISNALKNGDQQIMYQIVKNKNLVQIAIGMLSSQTSLLLQVALKMIKHMFFLGENHKIQNQNLILKEFYEKGGAVKLEQLNYHKSNKIYEAAYNIMSTFFVEKGQES